MTGLRTLPIRIDPLPGEALDSWLETLAFRMKMPVGDLLRSVGLKRRVRLKAAEEPPTDWIIQLQPQQAATVAEVTGTTSTQVVSMTLAAYDGRALLIDPGSGQVNKYRLWGRNVGSRYCPQCLVETGGRWSLSWRLGWSFACLRHQCLLADACPGCGRMQRIRKVRAARPIHPAHCSYPATGSTASTRCGTDLRDTVAARLDPCHPALSAQQIILEIIKTREASFGVYVRVPTASIQALADVRAIAGRALAPVSADSLTHHLPADLVALYQKAEADNRPPGHSPYTRVPHLASASPGFMAPSHAAVAAAGILVAVDVLGRPSIQEAGEALRWLTVEARSRGQVVNPTTAADWGRGTSPVLDGVTLASMQPVLRPSHQLRYRVMNAFPRPPDPAEGRIGALARSTPALLWPYWALRLAPSGVSARFLRAALSVLILLPGTKVSIAEAAAMLGARKRDRQGRHQPDSPGARRDAAMAADPHRTHQAVRSPRR
jgi:TniQ